MEVGQKILFKVYDNSWLTQEIKQGVILQISPSGEYVKVKFTQSKDKEVEERWFEVEYFYILEELGQEIKHGVGFLNGEGEDK